MGLLVDGKWQDRWYDTDKSGGRFVRSAAAFHDWIRRDGSTPFTAESGRYHLYVSYACPWAHRTLIVRALLGLEKAIGVSVVHPDMLENGWELSADFPGATGDRCGDFRFLYQVYLEAQSDYTGRVTVPVLWDERARTIVNNESSEIIRILPQELVDLAERPYDFYPEALRGEIDEVNERVYATVNNGVYRCGFATSQEAYEEAFDELFASIDWLEERLAKQRYLVGNRLSEADVRLFTTLLRFDAVYYGHFKCNQKRIVDCPNLWAYTRDLHQIPAVASTVHFDHIKRHYHYSHATINPHRIVPKGPALDFSEPHERGRLGPSWEDLSGKKAADDGQRTRNLFGKDRGMGASKKSKRRQTLDFGASQGEATFSETQADPPNAQRDGDAPGEEISPLSGRRRHPRYQVELEVSIGSEHNFYGGFVENLSAGGIFIATHQLRQVGDRLAFSVRIPGREEPVTGLGEVRWLREPRGDEGEGPGMGLRFLSLDPGGAEAIEAFTARRDPMFFDDSP